MIRPSKLIFRTLAVAFLSLASAAALATPITVIWRGAVVDNDLQRGPFSGAMASDAVTVTAVIEDQGNINGGFLALDYTDTSAISVEIGGNTLTGAAGTSVLFNTLQSFAFFDGINMTQTALTGSLNYKLLDVLTDFDPGTFNGTAGILLPNGNNDPRTLSDNQGLFPTTNFTGLSVIEDFQQDATGGTDFGSLSFLVSSAQIGEVQSVPEPSTLAVAGLGLLLLRLGRKSQRR